jgi:CBS domain containing-hemolysin-like protein
MTLHQLVTVTVGCVLGQAFFVGAEVALGASSRTRLRQQAQAGRLGARLAERLQAQPQVLLATTMLGSNLATVVGVVAVARYLELRGVATAWSVPLVIAPLLVLGQLVPKTVMQAQADRLAPLLAPPLVLASWLLRPAVLVVGGFAGAMTRLAGTDRKKTFVTRDELALLIESEPESDKPDITADEREMIANVFEMSEYTVGDLMVPLSEVTALPEDAPVGEAAVEAADKQHSRIPVYRSRVDDVVGVVHVFDILQAGQDPQQRLQPIGAVARPATYVPERMKAVDLLVELQAEGGHLAIVVDEYGGAVGVVTVEDLLETIVGDIDDEHDREPSPIKPERPGVWRVEARTPVARLNAELELGLPESDAYETVAGLLIEQLRHIPEQGATVTIGGVVIEVVAANDRAIEAVRLTRRKK